ncbi:MAG TPA: TonB-dependent receptor plug domain-containing protein [Flavobacterium sp.]|uniref:TonB-dependent receptor n=2 Tax=Flavobacterium TaxID=237 RepID=UPI0025BF85DD|nr:MULTISPECIES: TonB-dependent receptor plug domain-containing protein [unclassified Flavobacterium]HRE79193.1 TonB-dependent receptor plug domain-containing protein [Flavobacterium sp.]
MHFNNWRLSILITLFSVLTLLGQDQGEALPLKQILIEIEKQHNVTFNYIEEEIVIYKIISPNPKNTIEQKIDYIQTQTKLRFKFVNDELITISNNQKLDKPLCGYLVDSTSNIPIFNATIRISGTNVFVLSDEKGFFQLPVVSSNPIEISHVSYASKTIFVNEIYVDNCPTFLLNLIVQELEEVVAQLYLTAGIRKKTEGTFEIKPKKFGILPGLVEPDVLQTMQQIPGIISTDETIANVNVRGGTHDQNLFLWNGIRLFQTGHFYGLISALNPNLAHTIQLSKNGSSAFYGESVSSVIDISSRSNSVENTSSTVGVNMINAELYTKVKTSEKSSIEVAARRSFTDMLASPTYKNYFNRIFQNTEVIDVTNNQDLNYNHEEDFYFYDVTLQYHQKIGQKSELFFDALAISNELTFNESTLANNQTVSKNSQLNQQTLGGNLTLKTNWNAKNNSELSVYSSYYQLDANNQSVENNQILLQENTVLDNGIRLKNAHQLSETVTLTNGYQFNEIGIRSFDDINIPQFTRTVKEVLRSHALIAEIDYRTNNNRFFARLGARGNYFEKWSLFIVEPRLHVNYALTDHLNVELSGEQKNQTASQIIDLQQDFLGVEKRRWVLANNETIPIQKSNQASLGVVFRQNNWLIHPEAFYKKVEGITSSAQGFQNQLEFVKVIGQYEVYGAEVLIQKQINQFTGWFNYSFNNNDYTFEGYLPPQFANNFEVNHSMAFGATYQWKNLKMALGGKWFTGRPNTIPLSNEPIFPTPDNPEIVYSQPNQENLDDYFQVNFSASYSVQLGKKANLFLGVSVLNVFNQRNTINRFYRLNADSNAIEEVNTYSLELTPNAFLKVNF